MEGVRQEREAAHQRMQPVRPGDFKGPELVSILREAAHRWKLESDENARLDTLGIGPATFGRS